MTKQEFLAISGLLSRFNLDELDRLEFVMCYERDTKSKIPEDWLAEASLQRSEDTTDWSAFRREAAKDILCAMTSQATTGNDAHYKFLAQEAIKQADELVRKLKETEQSNN